MLAATGPPGITRNRFHEAPAGALWAEKYLAASRQVRVDRSGRGSPWWPDRVMRPQKGGETPWSPGPGPMAVRPCAQAEPRSSAYVALQATASEECLGHPFGTRPHMMFRPKCVAKPSRRIFGNWQLSQVMGAARQPGTTSRGAVSIVSTCKVTTVGLDAGCC